MTFKQLRKIAKKHKFTLSTPVSEIPSDALETILYGGDTSYKVDLGYTQHEMVFDLASEGIVNMLDRWYNNNHVGSDQSMGGRFSNDCELSDM